MAQVFILFYYTLDLESRGLDYSHLLKIGHFLISKEAAVTLSLIITEDYCQSQNDCDNTYVETVYKWFENFKVVYMHSYLFNNHQCYVVVKCCPRGQPDIITHVAIYIFQFCGYYTEFIPVSPLLSVF